MNDQPTNPQTDSHHMERQTAALVATFKGDHAGQGKMRGPVLELTWETNHLNEHDNPFVQPGFDKVQFGPHVSGTGRIYYGRFTTIPQGAWPPSHWPSLIKNLEEVLEASHVEGEASVTMDSTHAFTEPPSGEIVFTGPPPPTFSDLGTLVGSNDSDRSRRGSTASNESIQ